MPPSITSSVPTMYADSADGRYSMAVALSSGVGRHKDLFLNSHNASLKLMKHWKLIDAV
jgi:hypothetical protein